MSNWENRPLRYSQEHYGAMDAWILGEVMIKLIATGKRVSFDKNIKAIGEKVRIVTEVEEGEEPEEKREKRERRERKPKEEKEPRENKREERKQERKPREKRSQDEPKKHHEPDPAKISFYLEKIDFHSKKIQEFQDLLTKALEMEKAAETENQELAENKPQEME